MIKRILLFLLLCAAVPGSSQSIDSLQTAIALLPDDTSRAMAYRKLWTKYYEQDQAAEMLETAEKGLELSKKLRFDPGISALLFCKATTLDILGKGREAIAVFEEGLAVAQALGNRKEIADYYLNIGICYYILGDLDKALRQLLLAYDVYKQLNQQKQLSKVLNNIGIIYRTQGKHARAEEIYKESLGIKQALKDSLGMAASYQNLAAVLSISDREAETTAYLQKALALYEKLGRTPNAAGCHALMAQVYYNFKHFEEAKAALLRAKTYYDQKPSAEHSSNIYRILGSLEQREKNYVLAETYMLESARWARQFGQQERLWDILNELATIQQALGKNAPAYAALREAYTIRDSLTEKKRLVLMEEMQVKFDVAQKDNELKINQLDLKKRTLERNWLIGGAALFFLLSLTIFLGLRSRIRANKRIAAQEAALQQQQFIQLEQEAKLNALNAMIDGQEKERSRIAADLHDGLGGLLSSVKSHFNTLPVAENELYQKTNYLIDEACGEVRRISQNMMPRTLALSGLPGALEDLVQDLGKQKIRCELEMLGLEDPPLSAGLALQLYRIIQELSNNVLKHARADHLLLQLIRRDHTLILIAEDNGIGFDVQQARRQKGMGLNSVDSRVHFLRGEIDWDTTPGQGTTVSITIPV